MSQLLCVTFVRGPKWEGNTVPPTFQISKILFSTEIHKLIPPNHKKMPNLYFQKKVGSNPKARKTQEAYFKARAAKAYAKRLSARTKPGLVKTIKKVIKNEQETKVAYLVTDNIPLGQVLVNASGHNAVALIPTLAPDDSDQGIIGNQVTPMHLNVKIKLGEQAQAYSQKQYKFIFIQWLSPAPTSSFAISSVIDPDLLITGASIYDINSYFSMTNGRTYKVLSQHEVTLPQRCDSVVTSPVSETYNYFIPMGDMEKINFRTTGGAPYNADNYQIYCIMLANDGNASTATACTLTDSGVTNKGVSTGVNCWLQARFCYKDA